MRKHVIPPHQRWCFYIAYVLWSRVFHFSYLALRPNGALRQRLQRGILEWQTGGGGRHLGWVDTSKTCFCPQGMVPRMEIRVRVPRWWPRWILLVFSFNLRKKIFLYRLNVLTSDAYVVLRPWSLTDSFIAASKTQSVSFGWFPQRSSDRIPPSVWELL